MCARDAKPGHEEGAAADGNKQPGFIEAFQPDVELADNATFHDGEGASTQTAATSWQSFCSALGVQCLRPLDLISSSLSVKLSQMDLVKGWAFWRVKHSVAPVHRR